MGQLVFVLALLGATQGFYLPGVAPQDYAKVSVSYLQFQGPAIMVSASLPGCVCI